MLLGRARMMNSQPDAAFAAYRKAISLDPSSPRAYRVLSTALASRYRVPDAVDTLRDLLKVLPDDHDASLTLAFLLANSARYAEARPLLEKLLVTDDSYPYLHFHLGTAYLHLGEEEKSAEQLRKAMDLLPGHEMLNSVAYTLAEANRNLPDALRYAEQAVQETEGQTSVFQLASADSADFALMSTLAAEWDTMGWVYFRLGDLSAAERYLVAAWRLVSFPVVGDHLAQVYEKQGKKTLATRTYIAALNTVGVNGDPKLRDSLLARAKAGNPPDSLWASARTDAERMTTFTVPHASSRDEFAEFSIVFSKGPTVEEVKFLSGPDDLRSLESAISALQYNILFPDDAPTRIIRLGTLNCFRLQKSCDLILSPPPPPPPSSPPAPQSP